MDSHIDSSQKPMVCDFKISKVKNNNSLNAGERNENCMKSISEMGSPFMSGPILAILSIWGLDSSFKVPFC